VTETEPRTPPQAAPGTGGVSPAAGAATLSGHLKGYLRRLASGDLGRLPIVVGLLLIGVIFTSLNNAFISPVNFTNLIVQMSPLVVIAAGVVFVLLIAEVDLSVGYVSGVAAVVVARLLTENGWPVVTAVALVVLTGLSIGWLQGVLVAKVGLPSLVVTLAGLVGWNGLVLVLIAGRGTVTISSPFVVGITNAYLSATVAYGVMAAFVAVYAVVQLQRRAARTRADLPVVPMTVIVTRTAGVAALGFGAVFYASLGRGFPLIGVVLLVVIAAFTFVLERTSFGRHVLAIGGNREAARRAGINVDRIRIICFMISATMASLGGLVFASRLRSVDTNAGGGQIELNAIAAVVIGGTSLFGGHGKISSALFGALVIQGVDNGMGLLGLSSGAKFLVTGFVLLVAVLVDSVARRGRTRSGLA
jgi:D-xylose transport system permease protein